VFTVATPPKSVPWGQIEREQLTPLLQRQYFSTPQLTFARFELQKGCLGQRQLHFQPQ